jgi:hypothetical protein
MRENFLTSTSRHLLLGVAAISFVACASDNGRGSQMMGTGAPAGGGTGNGGAAGGDHGSGGITSTGGASSGGSSLGTSGGQQGTGGGAVAGQPGTTAGGSPGAAGGTPGAGGRIGTGGSSGGGAAGAASSGGGSPSGGAAGAGGSTGGGGDNSIAYIGCSMAWNIGNGYKRVGGKVMWNSDNYQTSAMVVQNWTNSSSSSWSLFDQKMQSIGGKDQVKGIMVQICIFSSRATDDEVKSMIKSARAHTNPGTHVYLVGQPQYEPGHDCSLAGMGGAKWTDDEAKKIAADSSVNQDLTYLGQFKLDSTKGEVSADSCHATMSGEDSLGKQAMSFFGG